MSSLAKASAAARAGFTSQGLGMFDMLNTTGVGNGGALSGEFRRDRRAENGGVSEVLNLMMSGAGRPWTGGLMDMLASGVKGVGGGGEGTGPDKEQMVKMAKRMTKVGCRKVGGYHQTSLPSPSFFSEMDNDLVTT